MKRIYDNCRMLAPDGRCMVLCGDDRMEWYVSRNLAVMVSNSPPSFRLLFEPAGFGHIDDPYYLGIKDNRCVVCGNDKDLSKHHIVPQCFRRYMPLEIKSHSSHDIVPLCESCHRLYESEYAMVLKKELCKEFNEKVVPGCSDDNDKYKMLERASSAAHALKRYHTQMPITRISFLKILVANAVGKSDADKVVEDDIDMLSKTFVFGNGTRSEKAFGKIIMKNQENLQEFFVRWRENFITSMSPKFMPEHWDVNRSIYLDG